MGSRYGTTCAVQGGMTHARRVIPGSTVLLTRRTTRRHHLFRPDPKITNLYLYTFGVLARKYGIEVHALALMSTHKHDVITDHQGLRPKFVAELHRVVALGTKILRNWEGSVWDERETSVVELKTPQAVINKIAYTITNPVAAGAVKRPEQWPGVCSTTDEQGERVYRVRRPDFYFDPRNSDWPEEIELRITLPRCLLEKYDTAKRAQRAVNEEIDRQISDAHAHARRLKRAFLGAAKVRCSSPYRRSVSSEPLRSRNPTFSTGTCSEAYAAAVAELRAFRQAYREARFLWRLGFRDVVFPFGTWAMAVIHNARTAVTSTA